MWCKLIVIAPVAVSITLLLSSCEDKITQCQRLIQVVNVGSSLIEANKGEQVVTSLQLSRDLQVITKSLQRLNLSDPNLKEFQSSFAEIFDDLGQAIAKASELLATTKNASASPASREQIQKARTEIDQSLTLAAETVGKKSDGLAAELNKYCGLFK